MAHRTRQARERNAMREASNAAAAEVLLKQHNAAKRQIKKIKSKRKEASDLLAILPTVNELQHNFIRPAQEWQAKSHNLDRQIQSLVEWLLCKYPVPKAFFTLFAPSVEHKKTHAGATVYRELVNKRSPYDRDQTTLFKRWFITIAQGGSFRKTAKTFFTKKEAHLFLEACKRFNNLKTAVWYARCKGVDLKESLSVYLSEVGFAYVEMGDLFWTEFIHFVKRFENEFDRTSIVEVRDYLLYEHRVNREFSLAGRTYGSVVALANLWHREQIVRSKIGGKFSWPGLAIPPWEWEDKKTHQLWTVTELRSSKELFSEGRRMKHCVASYAYSCNAGNTAIFTMESLLFGAADVTTHVTIEVNIESKRIVQVRGKLNRAATTQEIRILRKWTERHGIKLHYT